MTHEQIEAAFVIVCGIEPRQADLNVLDLLTDRKPTIGTVAEYIWDHWLGEPETPSIREVEALIQEHIP